MFEDFFKSDGFANFASNASNLGLKYIDNTYLSKKPEAQAQAIQAKRYEQIQQKAAPAPVRSPLDNKIFIYGTVGAVVLLTAIVFLKGK